MALLLGACVSTPKLVAPPREDAPERLQVFAPEGEGPFPVALILPGCEAPLLSSRAAFYERMAGVLTGAGFLAVIVSYPGAERGAPECREEAQLASVLAAIDESVATLRTRGDADTARLYGLGWSWGGRALLDLAAREGAPVLRAALVFYPPCPEPKKWRSATTLFMFLGQTDAQAPAAACRAWAEAADGPAPVVITRYVGAGHGFDIAEAGDPAFADYQTSYALVFDGPTAYQAQIDLLKALTIAAPKP